MSFLKQLLADAQPKADTLKTATINITRKAVDSRAVQVTKALGYKGLVNTVGIGACLVAPTVTKVWNAIERAAQTPEPKQ